LNYLSHYYIDNQPGNLYFNSALFLPDFARNYTRKFNNEIQGLTPFETQLQLGCLAHLNADKIFHPSSFFKKYNEIIAYELNKYNSLSHIPRKWFLAHILFEMLLDRLIVKSNIAIAHQFYNDLEKIDTKILENFVLHFSNKNVAQLIKNFEHFCKAKYLYGYAQNENFVYALSRVFKSGTGFEMSLNEKIDLKRFVILIEEKHFSEIIIVLTELKEVFKCLSV